MKQVIIFHFSSSESHQYKPFRGGAGPVKQINEDLNIANVIQEHSAFCSVKVRDENSHAPSHFFHYLLLE